MLIIHIDVAISLEEHKRVPAASEQYLSVHLDAGLAAELTAAEVGVVRRVDVVVGEWVVHVLVYI